MLNDRDIERDRYDQAGRALQQRGASAWVAEPDLAHVQQPYDHFHSLLRGLVKSKDVVVELGAGSGQHTVVMADSGATIVAVDISLESLKVAAARAGDAVKPLLADIQDLPLKDQTANVVVSAGALSYADPDALNREIRRVLRPGGTLIIVDSLNHNPVYRFNRWVHYRRGRRTRSTLVRMPDQRRIAELLQGFDHAEVARYGSWVFLFPFLIKLVGETQAAQACVGLDRRFGGGRNAFKFVLAATGYTPEGNSSRR